MPLRASSIWVICNGIPYSSTDISHRAGPPRSAAWLWHKASMLERSGQSGSEAGVAGECRALLGGGEECHCLRHCISNRTRRPEKRHVLSREGLGADATHERLQTRVPEHMAVPVFAALERLAAMLAGQGIVIDLHRYQGFTSLMDSSLAWPKKLRQPPYSCSHSSKPWLSPAGPTRPGGCWWLLDHLGNSINSK
jgi:hypothetical protein